jgi:hypothetical protein
MSRRDRREGTQISEKTSPGSAAASPAALHETGVVCRPDDIWRRNAAASGRWHWTPVMPTACI